MTFGSAAWGRVRTLIGQANVMKAISLAFMNNEFATGIIVAKQTVSGG
jgi:hypothetical protein